MNMHRYCFFKLVPVPSPIKAHHQDERQVGARAQPSSGAASIPWTPSEASQLAAVHSDATVDAWLKELGLGVQDRATFINALRSNSEIEESDECVAALPRPRMLRT